MTLYLLDTNVISDLVRNPGGICAQRIARFARSVCTSIIVAAELRYGIAKRNSPRLTVRVETALASLNVLPFEGPADVA